ncbi:hypothetical protein [Roseovarius sp. Pro17]|uniref:hypothetical protein n=1 Tax=Roseovarius sp. Pro17 TaxID=3108175 RepID=UPI002D78FCCF|nr:hypothetical protein [Roseovarius sp. Pro17]
MATSYSSIQSYTKRASAARRYRLEPQNASEFTDGAPGVKLHQTLELSLSGERRVTSSIVARPPTEKLELLANYTTARATR